ncbi:MAG: hypothetical protein KatS3mg045_1310 [Bellilinea sp.]|nr:MAG: hypothetical protein KatS3mg045_1310 [Bellilinea sp.]
MLGFRAFLGNLRNTTHLVLRVSGYNQMTMTPTVMQIGLYRFFFYSGDSHEPPHIHVERDTCVAKIWLKPVHLQSNHGFRAHEIRAVLKLVEEHQEQLLEAWNEYFSA